MTAVLSMARPFLTHCGSTPNDPAAPLTVVGCYVLSGSSRSLRSWVSAAITPCAGRSRPRHAMNHRGRDGPAYVDWVEQNLVLLAELTNAPRPTSRSARRNKLTTRPLIGARS